MTKFGKAELLEEIWIFSKSSVHSEVTQTICKCFDWIFWNGNVYRGIPNAINLISIPFWICSLLFAAKIFPPQSYFPPSFGPVTRIEKTCNYIIKTKRESISQTLYNKSSCILHYISSFFIVFHKNSSIEDKFVSSQKDKNSFYASKISIILGIIM